MLNLLFYPRSIAVIGASKEENKIGHVILKNLISSKYKGKIYPVNPKVEEILGLKCYKSLKVINESIALAVIVIPSDYVIEAVKECVAAKVSYVIPIAGGFSETGIEGARKEEELKNLIKNTETRIIGPNTVGIYVPESGVNTALTSMERTSFPPDGNLSFITQSGALGLLAMDGASEYGIGFSAFVNLGNRVDLDETELVEHFSKDEKTKAILCYIETFKNGRAFTQMAKKVGVTKPIIVLKAGRTAYGVKAASLHTGALGGNDNVASGAFKQSGVVRAYNDIELIDYGRALAYQKPLMGKNVAIVTTAGGVGVITTDLLTSAINDVGLDLAPLATETKIEIKKYIAPFASGENPIDLTAGGTDLQYSKILEILNKDSNVDGIIAYTLFQTTGITQNLIQIIKKYYLKKPMVVGVLGGEHVKQMLIEFEKLKIPAYPSIERTVKAMKVLYYRGQYLKRRY